MILNMVVATFGILVGFSSGFLCGYGRAKQEKRKSRI